MKKSRKLRSRRESGQAFAELMVCMVAIATIFLGVLLVSSFGADNISTLLSARETADTNARGSNGQQGAAIAQWSTGGDNMCASADDSPISGSGGSSNVYGGELSMTQAQGEIGQNLSLPGSSYDRADLLARTLSDNFYVSAADLTSAEATESNSLRKRNLAEMAGSIGLLLGGGSDITIRNSVYMPIIPN